MSAPSMTVFPPRIEKLDPEATSDVQIFRRISEREMKYLRGAWKSPVLLLVVLAMSAAVILGTLADGSLPDTVKAWSVGLTIFYAGLFGFAVVVMYGFPGSWRRAHRGTIAHIESEIAKIEAWNVRVEDYDRRLEEAERSGDATIAEALWAEYGSIVLDRPALPPEPKPDPANPLDQLFTGS